MGRIDLVCAEGILSPWQSVGLEDEAVPATFADLCVTPECCSTCGYPCEPTSKDDERKFATRKSKANTDH